MSDKAKPSTVKSGVKIYLGRLRRYLRAGRYFERGRKEFKGTGKYVDTTFYLLIIIILGVITMIMVFDVSDINSVFKSESERWSIIIIVSLTLVIGVIYLALKRCKIADDQLIETGKKHDLDRCLAGLILLSKDDLGSQLLGVRVLAISLEGEEAETAKSSLVHLLEKHGGPRQQWRKLKRNAEERQEKSGICSKTKDEIVKTLCQRGKLDLTGLNLSGAELSRVDLRNIDFSDANLSGAGLFKANLAGVCLDRANLEGTVLMEADLIGAHLVGANLSGASLFNANLNDADLKDACLEGAELGNVDLRGADLTNAKLGEVNLKEAKLGRANLENANLHGANLERADFMGADLSNVDLGYTDLSGADFREAKNLGSIKRSPGGLWAPNGLPKGLPASIEKEVREEPRVSIKMGCEGRKQ